MNRREFLALSGMSLVGSRLPAEASTPLLTLDGDCSAAGYGGLDDATLMAMPQVSFDTTTPWTAGKNTFSGPTLSEILTRFSAGPGDLRLTAANAYSVVISRRLITSDAPIIATRINGRAFGRREKGPLWILFPFDSFSEFRQEDVYAASVWQLENITVLKS